MSKTFSRARPKNLRKALGLLWRYIRRHVFSFTLVSVLAVISALASVYGTYLLKPVIDNYILPGNIPGLLHMVLYMALLYFIGVAATYGYSQIMVVLAQRVVEEMRNDLFRKVQKLPVSYFDGQTHGELMSRFTNDIETISDALNNSFAMAVQSLAVTIGTFVVLILLNIWLSVIVLLTFFCMFVFLRYSSKKSKAYYDKQQEYLGSLDSFVEETVSGQKVVQVFNHETQNFAEFTKRNRSLQRAAAGAVTFSSLLIPVVVSLSYFGYAVSACIGAFFAISGAIGLGTLASYLVYVRQVAMPINQFSQQFNFILASLSGAERIEDVFSATEEVDSGSVTLVRAEGVPDDSVYKTGLCNEKWAWCRQTADGSAEYIPLRGDVRFQNVVFGYVPGHPVIKGINLYAKPGQKIAFVGSTGAGKTTIASLINRFYEVTSGTITYDGIDVRDIRKDDLRRSLGVVLQDTHLFTGTIAENIGFSGDNIDRERIVAAAKLAGADSFIRRLPDGYDTVLTGDGDNLSQGQRQILSIARIAASDPPVLILDEATSSVDTHTERQIEKGMDRLMEGRTVFVIAHRLSTVRNANAILVLEGGEIIERGSHDELVSQKGRYYQLYTGQFELS
jgi:ABC-type multidrug transport system, ATPase and permease components